MGVREEILLSVNKIIDRKGKNEFSPAEVIREMRLITPKCNGSTIRVHICSRLCRGKNKNHGTTYEDFENIARGLYRLINH